MNNLRRWFISYYESFIVISQKNNKEIDLQSEKYREDQRRFYADAEISLRKLESKIDCCSIARVKELVIRYDHVLDNDYGALLKLDKMLKLMKEKDASQQYQKDILEITQRASPKVRAKLLNIEETS